MSFAVPGAKGVPAQAALLRSGGQSSWALCPL